jgi:hypothetical protein
LQIKISLAGSGTALNNRLSKDVEAIFNRHLWQQFALIEKLLSETAGRSDLSDTAGVVHDRFQIFFTLRFKIIESIEGPQAG